VPELARDRMGVWGCEEAVATGNPRESGVMTFPRVDRSVVTVGSAFEESDEKAFWATRTPLERLEAV